MDLPGFRKPTTAAELREPAPPARSRADVYAAAKAEAFELETALAAMTEDRDYHRNQGAILKGDVQSLESLINRTLEQRDEAQQRVTALETSISQVAAQILEILKLAHIKAVNNALDNLEKIVPHQAVTNGDDHGGLDAVAAGINTEAIGAKFGANNRQDEPS